MFLGFQSKCKGLASSNIPVYLNEEEDGRVHVRKEKEDSPEAKEKLSRRIALHNMRSVNFDLEERGIPLDIQGDSSLVVNWVCGRWTVLGSQYQERVDRIINTLDAMQSWYNIRPPEAGRDIITHTFREWNQRADYLTHEAREGRPCDYFSESLIALESNLISDCKYVPCLVKAGFDGGVCAKGSACGVWVEIGLRAPNGHIIMRDVFVECWLLHPTSTVTDTELSALERIIDVLPRVLSLFPLV